MSTLAAAQRLVGTTLGDYTLDRVLGIGGMGAVYRAVHRTIGRTAAIKVLHPELSGRPMVVQRFFNEARAVNMIRHPGIVDIMDYQPESEHGAFLVMEYLEGESLEHRMVREQRFSLELVTSLTRRIARPLQAAHERHIVHRDLKPANIFLVPDPDHPGEPRVKLLDFGIAKLGDAKQPGSLETSTGAVIGTPLYMSPEQCHGAKHIDHRTDIYALGVIVFEMLAGAPPFTGSGWGDIIVKHMREPPPSLRDFDPSTPLKVDEVVARALAKEPAQRYASIAELAEAFAQAAATKRETLPLSSSQMPAYQTGGRQTGGRSSPSSQRPIAPRDVGAASRPTPQARPIVPNKPITPAPTEPPITGPRQVSPRSVAPRAPKTSADALGRAATPPAAQPIARNPSLAAQHGQASVPTVGPGASPAPADREASIPTVTPASLSHGLSPEDASAPTIRPEPRHLGASAGAGDAGPTVIAGSGGSAGTPQHVATARNDGLVPETQIRAGQGAAQPPTERAANIGAAPTVPQTVMGHVSPDASGAGSPAVSMADDWRKRTAGVETHGGTAAGTSQHGQTVAPSSSGSKLPVVIAVVLILLGGAAFGLWFFVLRGKGPRLCEAGDVKGCRAACAAEHLRSCARLATALATRGLDKETAVEAARAAEKACRSGLGSSCLFAAEVYDPNDGKAKDKARAAELYARACSPARPKACQRLGELKRDGIGTKVDRAGALRALRSACDGGRDKACAAAEALGCDDGKAAACRAAAKRLAKAGDEKQAAALYRKACSIEKLAECPAADALSPASIDVAAVKAAALGSARALTRCHRRSKLSEKTIDVHVRASIDSAGKATTLTADVLPTADAKLGSCLADALRGVRYPKASGSKPAPVTFSLPLQGHKFDADKAFARAVALSQRPDATSLRRAQRLLRRVLTKRRNVAKIWYQYGLVSCLLRDCAAGREVLRRIRGGRTQYLQQICLRAGCIRY
ncbi:MAG: protein kinase [Myxococcales bacterium]|nr:protein kinase [Myxococcales bacterium]